MNNNSVYLKSNVVVEPLVDRWYAWPHLISPATAAMNIVGRHLKIMESFVRNPKVHSAAVKDPRMLGGPFIDQPTDRIEEIRALIAETRRHRAPLIELAEAIKQLDSMLLSEATGLSLHPLYEKIPEPLRGFVELVYDLNHHPSFRLIEPLLYRSRYYDESSQSLMLSLIHDDDRPFVLSTPRLDFEGGKHIRIPFRSPAIDDLFVMKQSPRPLVEISELLGVDDPEQIAHFFTPDPPAGYRGYEGDSVRWRYFGHACILIETRDTAILFDPVLSYTYENGISRYVYEDLPERIDYVLITHNHQDHILFETMLQLRHKVKTICVPRNSGGSLQDPSLKLMLQNLGFANVVEVDEMEEIPIPRGAITGIPFFGEHCDLAIQTKLAWLLRLDDRTLLFAADSCNIDSHLYDHIHDAVGDIDVLFLGMECDGGPISWLYGPLMTQPLERKVDNARRLSGSNYDQGIEIVNRFHFKEVYVYAMGQEPWLNYIMSLKYTEESNPIIASNRLIEECNNRGIHSERLFGEKEIEAFV